MSQFLPFTSRIVPLLVNNVDTDQIIPARFLKVTDKLGLGDQLFADLRYASDGSPNPEFILNKPEHRHSKILLAGDNFGCGSSREHAPWALVSFGIKAVISTSFADIFSNNALKNKLLPIVVNLKTHRRLRSLIDEIPECEFTVDLENQRLSWRKNEGIQFPIDGFSKACLLNGIDELGYILKFENDITSYETKQASQS